MKRATEFKGTHMVSSKEASVAKQKYEFKIKKLKVYGRKKKRLYPPL